MNTAGDRLWSAVELATRLGLTDWCDWEAARRNGVIPKPDLYLSRTRPRWKDRTIRAALGDAALEADRMDPATIIAELEATRPAASGSATTVAAGTTTDAEEISA